MLTYHTEKGLIEIRNAIKSYEIRNTKKPTESIKDDTVVNLASGIVFVNGTVQSISVNLKLYDLTVVKEIVCKRYSKSEITIFESVNQVLMFLYKACKEQLLNDRGLRVDHYA